MLYIVAWYSAKPDIERPNDPNHGFTHPSHRATVVSQVTVAERILTEHPRTFRDHPEGDGFRSADVTDLAAAA